MSITLGYWTIALVISAIGPAYCWTRPVSGTLDPTPLVFFPLGLCWALLTWLIYFVAIA